MPAPTVMLTPQEEAFWAPLPPDRSAIPVLLYHGLGPASNFSNAADAEYGVGVDEFAKQMRMIKHAGFQTVTLRTYLDFVAGKDPTIPPRPFLLTFDDARLDSWTGSDSILEELGFNAVVFVDVGQVDAGNPQYLRWDELATMQDSGRWDAQLHAGHGHRQIRYGWSPRSYGPFYAYKELFESFEEWQRRVRKDIDWGHLMLQEQLGVDAVAFAPPFGSYGQDGTNDDRIPGDLLGWLTEKYEAVFVQDVNARAKPGATQPLGRIEITRATEGGDILGWLLTGDQ